MNQSAVRLCMPELDRDLIVDVVKKLVLIDKDGIPHSVGTSLYIRPVMIATETCIGVRVSSKYLFYIITGPAGTYFRNHFTN